MKLSPLLFLGIAGLIAPMAAAPLVVDLTAPIAPAAAAPYGPGTTKNPQGVEITADQRSFFINGTPWIPVVGEFHYARYPRAEWRDELLKMKAGGIDTVSTYVFWIHHEEEQGKFDWSDRRSLRDFIKLAQEVGLKVVVRMGPWCHGEVRNGGFPDWVKRSGTGLRSTDPRFLALVEPFFKEEAAQMEGLLWKDGGPVIGIQLDNECDRADYLLALKKMARAVGVDVPFYTITGWQGGLPKSELIPLFGGYTEGFWGGSREEYRKEFMFNEVRAMNDLGAQMEKRNPSNTRLIAQFPYACAEIGGGMMSSYGGRIKIAPENIAALALAKIGSGNNLPGYYMYHGGTNPTGKLSYLHEDHPNQLPVKDYDFQAPLGAVGQVRPHYGLLREQHLFLQDFGAALARMPPFFPEKKPSGVKDFDTLRWDMRADGKSGFIFFSNQQPYEPLPPHKDVQFSVKTAVGELLVPRSPLTIPSGAYGLWPVNLDCDGVRLDYATVQPLCRIAQDDGTPVYFFAALEGVRAELSIKGQVVPVPTPGTGLAAEAHNATGQTVRFVVLTPEQATQLGRVSFAGRERLILTNALVLQEPSGLRLQTDDVAKTSFALFPRVGSLQIGRQTVTAVNDGGFSCFTPSPPASAPLKIVATLEKPAGPSAASLNGTDEKTWNDAAVYRLDIPVVTPGRRIQLDFNYTGDAARLYVGDEFITDNYYNGDPLSVALWRIPDTDWSKLRLKVLPCSDRLLGRLPEGAKKQIADAKAAGTLDKINVAAKDRLELRINPVAGFSTGAP